MTEENNIPLKLLSFILLYSVLFQCRIFGQQLTNVVTFDSSNSAILCYDIDPDNNIYFGGYFRSSGDSTFENLVVTSPYWSLNGLTFKTDTTGMLSWITLSHGYNGSEGIIELKYFGGSVYSLGKLISYTSNIFVNSQNFTSPYTCCNNGYLLKQTEAGVIEWLYPLPYQPLDLEVDNFGNSYIATNNLISKIDVIGNESWTISLGSSHSTKMSIANDTLYVAGNFLDSLICFNDTLRSTGQNNFDMFIAKFDLSGNYFGITRIGSSTTPDMLYDIKTDNNGSVWMMGFCDSISTIGTNQICGVGKRTFIIKLNSDATIANCISFPTSNGGTGELLFNAANEMYTVINIADSIIINGNILTVNASGAYEGGAVIMKHDIVGNLLWYRPVATPSPSNAIYSVAWVSAHLRKAINGKIIVAGQMHNACFIDSITYNSPFNPISYFALLDDSQFSTTISEPIQTKLFVRSPTKDFIDFFFDFEIKGDLILTDISGRQISTGKITSRKYQHPIPTIGNGVYFYFVFANGICYKGKVVVQH